MNKSECLFRPLKTKALIIKQTFTNIESEYGKDTQLRN